MKTRRIAAVGGFGALAAVLALTGLATGAANDMTLLSRAAGAAGAVGDDSSLGASISADGRYVAFESDADNLDPDSNDAVRDVFVRDTQMNATTLVSRATGAAGAVGDDHSGGVSISADGRYVAFTSQADNLDPDSNDAVFDVFVRDTQMDATTLVSRATGAAGAVGDGSSFGVSISADGRYVAFDSEADNLDLESNDAVRDVFVRDTQMNETALVSRAAGVAGAVGDGSSFSPSISDDGSQVAFYSDADNLDLDSNDAVSDVFVRDTQTSATALASRATGAAGAVGDGNSLRPSISDDGRHVAFDSEADNLDPDSGGAVSDIFVRDTQTSATALVSRATGAAGAVGDGDSFIPSISADGRHVAFESDADNLDLDSNDAVFDVFVRDTQTSATALVSRAAGAAGTVGDGGSDRASISADGRYVAFDSEADNLDPDSNDAFFDVFLRELELPPAAQVPPVGEPPAAGPTTQPPPAKKCRKGFKLKKVKTKSGKKRKKCVRKKSKR